MWFTFTWRHLPLVRPGQLIAIMAAFPWYTVLYVISCLDFIKSLYYRVIQLFISLKALHIWGVFSHVRGLWKHHQSEEPLKGSFLIFLSADRCWLRLPHVDFSPSASAYRHVNIVHFSVEKLHFRTEDISVSTGQAPSFSTPISWFTSFNMTEPPLHLHHPRHASCPLYAICFAHCVHIYIDVMHIFIHV